MRQILSTLIELGNDATIKELQDVIANHIPKYKMQDEEIECLAIIEDYFELKKSISDHINNLVKDENGFQELRFEVDYFKVSAILWVTCDISDASEHASPLSDIRWSIVKLQITI